MKETNLTKYFVYSSVHYITAGSIMGKSVTINAHHTLFLVSKKVSHRPVGRTGLFEFVHAGGSKCVIHDF